jgi:type III secretory pathway lipoprotein EscJ
MVDLKKLIKNSIQDTKKENISISFENFFTEEKKKRDRCLKKADSVYGKKTSAYKSGAVVKCRQGKIWKKKK